MGRSNRRREIIDEQKRLIITVFPYVGHAVCTIDLGHRDHGGVRTSRLAYWHLDLTRGQLAGRSMDDVLRAIVGALVRRVEEGPDSADRTRMAEGPGAPLGATGGTVTQDPLPGL